MTQHAAPKSGQWIRQAVDFGALMAFLAAYLVNRVVLGLESHVAMIQATWVLVGASAVALLIGYLVEKRLAPLPLLAGGFALIFGVLTLVFQNEELLKIKITVQNLLLAAVLLGSLPLRKYPFKYLLGSAIRITDEGWRGLTLRYGLFFAAVAVVNEVVRHMMTNDAWMTFRGGLWMASAAFGIWQVFFIMKHLIKDEDEVAPVPPDPGL
ncbi:intracellular septation protein A [Brevundimonas sp. S30B]|jgi:intracellular septation protein|uniref:inner membrane-spanning protein YciB n=1 Tax=unclassified Brevundimonas TaxID=2622653 RepID=UPI001072BA96|nr:MULTISPECIES: septation protein IspZ [unclassified Brevundimonas]QBX36524.1 intracellular septation protein A [Brevundimonas sp. MF30-B]TFW00824.1 intracellular septation protein A [Brevundimonas sp. S30B]